MIEKHHVFVIAEASGNHNKDYGKARALVEAAAEAGADAIKYQLFAPETLCADIPLPFGHSAVADAWFTRLGVTRMRELFSKGGLPREWCLPLKEYANALGIEWMCTPFSVEEARFLVEEVGVSHLKIASGDLTFVPLIRYAGASGVETIISTGCGNLKEVRQAAGWFAEGEKGQTIQYDHEGRPEALMDGLSFLHCLSVYPCDRLIVNLKAIETIAHDLWLPCGFSDHTTDTVLVPALAVSCGASLYEKHLKLANDTDGVDSEHSITPDAFRQMVGVIRTTPHILGDGKKEPHALERHDRIWARRSPTDWLRPTEAARLGQWE